MIVPGVPTWVWGVMVSLPSVFLVLVKVTILSLAISYSEIPGLRGFPDSDGIGLKNVPTPSPEVSSAPVNGLTTTVREPVPGTFKKLFGSKKGALASKGGSIKGLRITVGLFKL